MYSAVPVVIVFYGISIGAIWIVTSEARLEYLSQDKLEKGP